MNAPARAEEALRRARPEGSPASAPAAGDAALAQAAIDSERLRLIARQTVRAPIGVAVAAGFIAYTMAPHAGAALAWGWAAAALGSWALRAVVCARLLARPPATAQVRPWLHRLVAAAAASGAIAGATAVLFFGAPPLEWSLLTMVLCAWAAGGIAVSAAVPAAFYGLATLFLAPLAVGWAASDMPLKWPVAAMILFFLGYLILFARDGALLVANALRVGFENEDLARQLRQRESEARLARERAEQANVAKSRFLAAASHDLRQPLHSLVLLLDHALRTTSDAKTGETLRQAARSADSLQELFDSLLDLSRLDAGSLVPELKPVALGAVLERIANDYRPRAESKGLAFRCAATTAWVRSDPVMLDRMLRNLLDNAVKYTDTGGIEVEVHEAAGDGAGGSSSSTSSSGGDHAAPPGALRVSVRDSGIGIDSADRGRIFEEYFQAGNAARDRTRGIGLGLAIVKRLADLLGHAIDVDSAPGCGSTFAITLARTAPAPQALAEALPGHAAAEALRGTVVVVIEDDAEVAAATRALLADWGCRTVVAGDSASAIAELDAAGIAPDAILADWRLAGAENGGQAIEKLEARFGARLAAIITGELDPAAIAVPAHLAVTVMQKPVRARELADWLLLWKSIE